MDDSDKSSTSPKSPKSFSFEICSSEFHRVRGGQGISSKRNRSGYFGISSLDQFTRSSAQAVFGKYLNSDENLRKTELIKDLQNPKDVVDTQFSRETTQESRMKINIERALSVSRAVLNRKRTNSVEIRSPELHGFTESVEPSQFGRDEVSYENSSAMFNAEDISPKAELCMEFLWCFPCCFYQRSCQLFYYCAQFDKTTLYDIIWYMFYAPIFNHQQIKTTKLQRCVLFVRLCFELYKTMIGSYLTVFTPQDCGHDICTLYENLIPKDDLEVIAITMNSVMAFFLLSEYAIEMTREKILRTYFKNDQRLPVEKEYFTNLLGILDTKKAALLDEQSRMISIIFRLYRRIGIILLTLYIINVSISGVVIYKNYYDKSSLFGFVTNALFIVFKMASILKIAIHSINMPYSAYIETPVAFNSLKTEYICPEIKKHFLFGIPTAPSENIHYFHENKQYMRFLLEDYVGPNPDAISIDIDDIPVIRHRNSFG